MNIVMNVLVLSSFIMYCKSYIDLFHFLMIPCVTVMFENVSFVKQRISRFFTPY